MYICMLHQAGESLVHRHMPTSPEALLKTSAPDREQIVMAVECLFPWYWRADLCARAGLPFVLGHALSMQAIHGGKAKHATSDAQKLAGLLRGGMWPQASGSPAQMRATRALLRRRLHLLRTRAEVLTPLQHTTSQDNWPERGKKMASQANRAGVAERFAAPAVPQSIAVDLALLDHYDHLLRDMARTIRKTATQPEAHTLYLLRTVPGSGASLRLVWLDAIHDIQRFPRGQDLVAYGRLVTCAKDAAGKRYGTAGTKLGHADLPGAFSEAAVLFVRAKPRGQPSLTRVEKKHAKGTALTVLAHPLARAVYDMVQRKTAFDRPTFCRGYRSAGGEPAASLAPSGSSLRGCSGRMPTPASMNAQEHVGSYPRSLCVAWTSTSAPSHTAIGSPGGCGLPLSRTWPSLAHGIRSATSLRRTVRGPREVARPQRSLRSSLCTRAHRGDRASIRVWCRHTLSAPRSGNAVRTRRRVPTAPPGHKRKNCKKIRS